ncbi:MAG: type I restriction endonuclease subunit R [Akkermansiaceae bacterium]|nr:type I restriction endonuclease subunit R [Akkermansiaceae bacterium]
MSAKFNEDSRVKIPSILHLVSMGYDYLSLKDHKWDSSNNIFTDVFKEAVDRINGGLEPPELNRIYKDLSLKLDNEDLGKAFYEAITTQSGTKLIDFEDFSNNTFHVVTELPCVNGDEEFRPDITLLINGMPLVFIEVKKPNNRNGILAERRRINTRFQNKKFRRFVNITQLMVFSNNMEYDDSSPEPLQGAYYASPSYTEPIFNYFREENEPDLAKPLTQVGEVTENFILKDTNLQSIKDTPEFATNKSPDTPTNRLSTALFSRARLAFLLKFGIAYVHGTHGGYEKHIMRYPQIFATMAIEQALENGTRKGIIWHTQGSGKTALAYYNVHHLTDYFSRKGIIPKFYFIVDRIDLLTQASHEFKSRGLVVHTVNSRDAFARDIRSTHAIHNDSGRPEITVVNIQKFKDESDVVTAADYDIKLQRVYFLDEVHRSYNPEGSFLSNLNESDPNAIKIGLTGTPLIGDNLRSRDLFGDYIHKYYYNASIADGYTLRLIREEIETKYKMELAAVLEEIDILKDGKNRKQLNAHAKFVEPMLDYIVRDFEQSRIAYGDPTIGAMVICDSAEQARMMAEVFERKYSSHHYDYSSGIGDYARAAGKTVPYHTREVKAHTVNSHALILHDVGTKDDRRQWVEDFKDGNIDILFVFNMLLTGFDAKRLKKLYLGRIIKAHNLLQALTRVNRTYKSFRYGYVVDFVDISKQFKKTNEDYFRELEGELGSEIDHYSNLFKTEQEITAEIEEIKHVLLHFDTDNAETFSQQISEIQDRDTMRELTRALNNARSLYNLIRLSGQYEMLNELDFRKLTRLSIEANNHLALLNEKHALEQGDETKNLLNVALEDILFMFHKTGESELVIADELKNSLRKTREGLGGSIDPGDPEFLSLKAELERIFQKMNLQEMTQEDMKAYIEALDDLHARARELERKNQLLRAKYANDAKYARIHKRLREKGEPTRDERKLIKALQDLKKRTDEQLVHNSQILNNESFSEKEMVRIVIEQFKGEHNISLTPDSAKFIKNLVMKEYLAEYHGQQPA